MTIEDDILAALDRNDLDAARDLQLSKMRDIVGARSSWDSPQYAAHRGVQESIVLDETRNVLFTYFGLTTLSEKYFIRSADGDIVENPQTFWARVATGIALAGFMDEGHTESGEAFFTMAGKRIKLTSVKRYAQALYEVMSKMWFCPATPILTNIGTNRGLAISCFLNDVADSMEGITDINTENAFIGKGGGGIGTYWGNVRHRGAKLKSGGKSSGIVPFLKIMDAQLLAVSQGGTRRGAGAAYLPIWHPEIEEFIEIRKTTGGDENRRCLNLNHGVCIDDAFMHAVLAGSAYDLRCPKTSAVVKTVNARELFCRILTLRLEHGEPYVIYIDTVNASVPLHHKAKGLFVQQSNLCTEITLPTSKDRTAVCCLGSMNLEKYSEWCDDRDVVYLAVRALDNVLQAFVNKADNHYAKAKFSAENERSIGLGVMGMHGMLMKDGIPFESLQARLINKTVFKKLHHLALTASNKLAQERGVCPDAIGTDFTQRNSYVMAIAPTATISIIAGNATPCTELITGNAYVQKTVVGSFLVKNRFLSEVLAKVGCDNQETWSSITAQEGSVQHLTCLTDEQKLVFKTAWEIDQRIVVDLAAARAPYICQAQSINLFFDANPDDGGKEYTSMKYMFEAHVNAWLLGLKSLYYVRSRSVLKNDSVERAAIRKSIETGESCQVCQ